ncbi:flavodoxin family protein [Carboxylicivirga sediminis]|uniref:Flavodoxin family protein n=1 Tax=Carboxylicivirga sediminis TaxID=2006564 RepID=A0A941F6W0_9BACT|nr:flavodoxin family protein [Carboxylicivirga sediminis]MBR8538001.1 flavodoxin family protein [Carboxylicivirga sediminis]
MKVLAINGSPHKKGNTYLALTIVCEQLNKEGIETEIIAIGHKKIQGCTACNACAKSLDERCIIDDGVNELIQQMKAADGILFGAPVHYADIGGTMKAFLDRAFYVAGVNQRLFRHKVAAGMVAVRRTGGMPAINTINNYLQYSEMFIPASNYWNVIHGLKPGDALKDEEGVQIARILGKNMAWLLKAVHTHKQTEALPEVEEKTYMHFIR